MSAQEMIMQHASYMSDSVAQKVYPYMIFVESLEKSECPICKADDHEYNAETIESLENCVNDRNCETFYTIDELRKFVDGLGSEEDEAV
jgi:hypothetical protein